jgi:hypothetical protein
MILKVQTPEGFESPEQGYGLDQVGKTQFCLVVKLIINGRLLKKEHKIIQVKHTEAH